MTDEKIERKKDFIDKLLGFLGITVRDIFFMVIGITLAGGICFLSHSYILNSFVKMNKFMYKDRIFTLSEIITGTTAQSIAQPTEENKK